MTKAGVRYNLKHGLYKSPEYIAWRDMRRRCKDVKYHRYPDYGGRGITVCPTWDASFEAFIAEVGRRPSDAHSLERIRNNEGYGPGNVRWATRVEQGRNTRASRFVDFRGQTVTLVEACEMAGIGYNTVRQRLFRGWPMDRALTETLDTKRSEARRGK